MDQMEQCFDVANNITKGKYDISELLATYRAGGPDSEAALIEIIQANYGLIGSIIEKHFRSYAQNYYEDMFSCGKVGLMNAIDHYDPDRSRPSTYFTFFIRHEIYDYVTQFISGVSSHKAKRVVKVSNALERLEARGIVDPTPLEVAEEIETMGYELGDPFKIADYQINQKFIEDAILLRRAGQTKDYINEDYLDDIYTKKDEFDEDPESAYLRKEREETISAEFYRCLTKEEQFILTRIYDLDGRHLDKTHAALAKELGVSTTQIRSMQNDAIKKLKHSKIAEFHHDHKKNVMDEVRGLPVNFKPSTADLVNQVASQTEIDRPTDNPSEFVIEIDVEV